MAWLEMTADNTFSALKYKRFGIPPGFNTEAIYWVNDLDQLHREGGPAVEFIDGTNKHRISSTKYRSQDQQDPEFVFHRSKEGIKRRSLYKDKK